MVEMYTKSILLEEITREEYRQRAAALGIRVPSAGNHGSAPEIAKIYAKISHPLVHELNGEETKEAYCQLFSFLLLEHPYCRQIRVRRGDEFVAKKQKNVRKARDMEDLGYVASLAAGGYKTDDLTGKDVLKLQFRMKKNEPKSQLLFRHFGNKLVGYSAEIAYCHRDLFDARINKEYSVVNGLWIPGDEAAEIVGAERKSAERIRADTESAERVSVGVKSAEEMVV